MNAQKILVVEDERIIALDIQNRLRNLGYEVVGSASNGPDAVEKARALSPDMVLMDINLEGDMDGTQAAKLISDAAGPPVVFLSAYATDNTLEKALDSAPYGYLLKPIDTRELHATLQATLNRHNLEKQVTRSERRLQLALDAAELGVWEWEPQSGQFVTAGLFSQVLGDGLTPLDESLGRFIDRLLPDERDLARHKLQQAIASKARISDQFRYSRDGGGTGWLELHARAYRENGTEWLTGVIKDITDRRRMEEELRQSAAVFETIAEGLFTLDSEGKLASANPAFESLTGYSLEEVQGKDPEQFMHARRHSDNFYASLIEMHDGQWQGETQCRRKTGEVFPVWESVRAVTHDDGSLSHYVAAITDISELRRAEEKVHHLAYHDPLTGLPNRMLLDERLEYTLNLMQLKNGLCAVLFLDVDGFKLINDSLGHASGDLLLQTMAARLQRRLRNTDTVARMGGDEFVVVLADLERRDVIEGIARDLLECLTDPVDLFGNKVAITGSVGIACYPDDGMDRQELLQAADTAMYHAKRKGKNQLHFYTPQLTSQISERMRLEQDLRRAISTDQLVLHYQPQFDLEGKRLTGVEALVRWQHPELGLVRPDVFIPIAEETGLINPLGSWVLQRACEQMRNWSDSSGRSLTVAINVSAQQIIHGEILEHVRDTLANTGFPAECLEIEVTESALQSLEDSRLFMKDLHDMGITVAIDDFGTGYSSLSVLKHLKVDRLKIDKSFIQEVPSNEQDAGIVEAIIAMAHKLNLSIIAEGIEDQAQIDYLRQAGCASGQGYLLGRPMPWDQLEEQVLR